MTKQICVIAVIKYQSSYMVERKDTVSLFAKTCQAKVIAKLWSLDVACFDQIWWKISTAKLPLAPGTQKYVQRIYVGITLL